VKYLAYAAWSYYRFLSLRNHRSIGSALGFGFVRLGLGMLFGGGIFLIGAVLHLNVPAHPWLLYRSIYAAVRDVEWSILAALLGARCFESATALPSDGSSAESSLRISRTFR
jgi:hypothetical protein